MDPRLYPMKKITHNVSHVHQLRGAGSACSLMVSWLPRIKKSEVAALLAETFCRVSRSVLSILEMLLDHELVTRLSSSRLWIAGGLPIAVAAAAAGAVSGWSHPGMEPIWSSGSMATGDPVTFGLLGSLGLSM